MFEFDKYDRRAHRDLLIHNPHNSPDIACVRRSEVAAMSMLFWGEHCIECAAPQCYVTCDLYEPRSDGRCRRFDYGIRRNRAFPSLRGAGAEVTFKTWGRLKANGNTRMEPLAKLLWKERLTGWRLRVTGAAGRFLFNITGNPRWKEAGPDVDNQVRRLHRRKAGGRGPDAFLMEVYNPSPQPVTVLLEMRVGEDLYDPALDAARVAPPFAASVALPSGYSGHPFDRSLFKAITESGLPFKVTVAPEGEDRVTLVFLTLDFIVYRESKAPKSVDHRIKCVAFDLDDTLWDGVLLEDQEVRPRDDAVRLIEALDRRGILVSIASKNDPDLALAKLEDLNIADYFLHPQFGWGPKSESLERIAAALNIGLDTFAFVDDSGFERDEVARQLPGVACVDATGDLSRLLDDPRFRGGGSADAGNRRSYYRDAIVRERDRLDSETDYMGFLASSRIELEIGPYRSEDFERVAELAQRTNQLNFSGTKYTRDDLRRVLADDALETAVLRCSDRYGSYGTVGLVFFRRAAAEIRVEEFMLSCRVQGKFIEQALFDHITRANTGEAVRRLWVNFHPTARNAPARQTLERLHFRPVEGDVGLWLDVDEYPLTCEFIETVTRP